MNDAHDDFKALLFAAPQKMTVLEYLEESRTDKLLYASAPERMLKAFGEPFIIDTAKDQRMGRIFANRTIQTYPESMGDFYGLEEVIERIVGFVRAAAQGLEEKKQILYLLGPVGGGKSSLAERFRMLMERLPIYVLGAPDPTQNGQVTPSPIYESPLGLFDQLTFGDKLEKRFHIPRRRLSPYQCVSPWAVKRLVGDFKGDWTKFSVFKLQPSYLQGIGVVKTEPGDENNQDISTLVGKVNIRMLEQFNQNDADAYSYSGALNRSTQGVCEFVEMFKAPLKMLHPLLTATQDRTYAANERVGSMPYQGMVIAHSNESEWQTFKANKNNEAFLDRVYTVKVPYCLRVQEERLIYEKLIKSSELAEAPCVPDTIDLLARFSVLTRLKPHENAKSLYSKMRVYDGESLKDTDPHAKTVQEYRDAAGLSEGMDGASTRAAYKILAETFNFDANEIAADPVHLLYVIEQSVRREELPEDKQTAVLNFLKEDLTPRYAEKIGNEIRRAYLESYDEFGQNMFNNYIAWADAWCDDHDFKDPDSGQLWNKKVLEEELSKVEKPAGISNPKDFRFEVVKYALRNRDKEGGKNPNWKSYEKIREVIEKRMFANIEDLLSVISFGKKQDVETDKKHGDFVKRMIERGYTARQVRRLVEWYMRIKKSQ